jgi:hypothetical protein
MIERASIGAAGEAANEMTPSRKAYWLGLVSAFLAVGCGANVDAPVTEEELLGSAEQAIGEAACLEVTPTATITDGGLFRSATQYTIPGCEEAVVVEVAPFEFRGQITLRDVGAAPTNSGQCENLGMVAEFFGLLQEPGDPDEFMKLHADSRTGDFPPGGPCVLPRIDFNINPLVLGLNRDEIETMTRIRVVMRAGANILPGSATRPIEIAYTDP